MITLFDVNPEMIAAWYKYFKDCDDVKIKHIPIEELLEGDELIVTAGNSYGIMDGGIDLAVRNWFNKRNIDIQSKIQWGIVDNYNRLYLPVGESILYRNLIYAPTMEYPQKVSPANIYYVFYRLLEEYGVIGFSCCGLCSLTGQVNIDTIAKMMRVAYNDFKNRCYSRAEDPSFYITKLEN